MRTISEEQRCIREERIQLKTKFEEIERQCYELKQETQLIAKQSAMIRLKIVVMFATLKAEVGEIWFKLPLSLASLGVETRNGEEAFESEGKSQTTESRDGRKGKGRPTMFKRGADKINNKVRRD
ncbi:hypothetical protein Gotur_000277 [Gossypium turneri]